MFVLAERKNVEKRIYDVEVIEWCGWCGGRSNGGSRYMEACCDCVIAVEIEINGQTSCVGTAKFPWMVYACPLARITGPFTCGFGRYGIVAPFGGDCKI